MPAFTNRVVSTNGLRLALRDEGRGPAVVLCHGFPELAWSWRHQVPALAAAGFRVLAPDQRGYGDSDRPDDVAAYDVHHLTGDLVGLLDALDIERAVFVGHDWGGLVAWMLPLLHPARTAGVVGVNTPYLPRPPMAPVAMIRAALGEPLLDDAELQVYVDAFTRTGFTGGINWYRNMDRNWETTPQLDGARITVPSLMVVAEWDPALRPELAAPMTALVDDLETVTIPRCGHWTQQEHPDALNRILLDWLRRGFG